MSAVNPGVDVSGRLAGEAEAASATRHRHSLVVRVTHWVTVVAFLALLVSGLELVVSHPRFYWGEVGNSGTEPLFRIPIPASRVSVPTGYGYLMPDENGWSRYLHFEAAWVAVLTGVVYVAWGIWSGHVRRNLVPVRGERNWGALWAVIRGYWRRAGAGMKAGRGLFLPPLSAIRMGHPDLGGDGEGLGAYNAMQRVVYLGVIFVLFPGMIWTGLALSPAFDSAVPAAVDLLGGRQSARTLHFLDTGALVAFLVVHVAMVWVGGFRRRMRGMITRREVVAGTGGEEESGREGV